jgi:hypothetical protein
MIGGAVVAAGLVAAVALAALVTDTGTYDVTVSDKEHSSGLVDIGNGSVEYIGSSANNQSSGTGIFDPFVRLQGSPTEKGYNTDGAVAFDTKTGQWTHAIKVNAIPVVDCDGDGVGTATCWELFVDINENNTAKRVSLNEVEIWFTTDKNLVGFVDPAGFPAPATQEYDFSGAILINDVNQGSGRGDLRYLVPTAGHTWDGSTYFVLYSKWGTTPAPLIRHRWLGSDGGSRWKVRRPRTSASSRSRMLLGERRQQHRLHDHRDEQWCRRRHRCDDLRQPARRHRRDASPLGGEPGQPGLLDLRIATQRDAQLRTRDACCRRRFALGARAERHDRR